jgi:hypothetical protein
VSRQGKWPIAWRRIIDRLTIKVKQMTDVVFVSRYEKRVRVVQDVLKKNSKLSDKVARQLAVEVVDAFDHIPEARR